MTKEQKDRLIKTIEDKGVCKDVYIKENQCCVIGYMLLDAGMSKERIAELSYYIDTENTKVDVPIEIVVEFVTLLRTEYELEVEQLIQLQEENDMLLIDSLIETINKL